MGRSTTHHHTRKVTLTSDIWASGEGGVPTYHRLWRLEKGSQGFSNPTVCWPVHGYRPSLARELSRQSCGALRV